MERWSFLQKGDLAVDPIGKFRFTYCLYRDRSNRPIGEIISAVLSGSVALILEGVDQGIIIDVREYPARGPEEPDIERVSRGSRDGFVETIVFNTALIRRRIRDPKLRMEIFTVGRRSKTDVVVSYIEDIANPELVDSIKENLSN